MSQLLLNRNPVLQKFVDNGLHIKINNDLLLILDIPYININKEVRYGVLVSQMILQGTTVAKPNTHVAYFIGEFPCDQFGKKIQKISHSDHEQVISGLSVNRSFSNKTDHSYDDEYSKLINYVNIITAPVHLLDQNATPYNYKQPELINDDPNYVFNYIETNSTRGHFDYLNEVFKNQKIGIIGMGGTGGYLLDLIVKTPVKEIHIFDDDAFHSHNAFRAPGAPTIEELNSCPSKVTYFKSIYSKMHKHITEHSVYVTKDNVEMLSQLSFVFISIDANESKRTIVEYLHQKNIPFIDIGIDVNNSHKLTSTIRTTFVNKDSSERWKQKIPFSGKNVIYDANIQIAELNNLAAIYAIIQWKKSLGFYKSNINSDIIQYVVEDEEFINEN